MSGNEVAETKGKGFGAGMVLADPEALAQSLEEGASEGRSSAAGDYLNFSGKMGKYTIGKEKRVVEKDELWLVNVGSFEKGWMCWKGGQPKASRMAAVSGTPVPTPNFDEFGPFDTANGEGWHAAKAFVLKSVDNDQQAYFKTNSISGISAFSDLQGAIAPRVRAGESAWPLISLNMEEFTAQGYKNFAPKFEVYGWLNNEAVDKLFADDEADLDELIAMSEGDSPPKVEQEETPKRKRRAAAEPEEKAEEEPAPRRRRRKAL